MLRPQLGFLIPGERLEGQELPQRITSEASTQCCDFSICRECPDATLGGYQLGLADSLACSCNLVQSIVWPWLKGPKSDAQTKALRGCCGEPTESRSESIAGVFETGPYKKKKTMWDKLVEEVRKRSRSIWVYNRFFRLRLHLCGWSKTLFLAETLVYYILLFFY